MLEETERWFIRRGTPHLIDHYSASQDIFTRAAPALLLVFLFSMFGAGNLDWPWWQNVLAVAAGFGLLVGAWTIANRSRGRAPFARPTDVGRAELIGFVGAPAVLQLLSGQPAAALGTAITLAGLLGLLYLVTSYGLVAMTRWALVEMLRELQAVVGLVLRALPLLLLVVTFLFINAELWDVAANAPGEFFAVVVVLFAALAALFLVVRLPAEFDLVTTFDDPDDLAQLVVDTPVQSVDRETLVAACDSQRQLSTRQRFNLILVALFSQGLQIVLVSVLIGLFFVVLGLFAISPTTLEHWTGGTGDVLVETTLWGNRLALHAELLRTAGFLAAFSSLHFTVTLITDDTYRREFFDAVLIELRQTVAVWVLSGVLRGQSNANGGGDTVAGA